MVTAVTSFGRSGLYDWMMQRITAVVLAAYTLLIVGYLITTPDLTYAQWSGFFGHTWVRVFSLLTLLSIGAHSWIGLWQVSTDYIKQTGLRFVFQAVCGTLMFVYVVWGIQVIWGL
ncbi:succinate dehydrogenase [Pokkaliibacter plantistimulans]|uniref:Succinate dehydrogenase hydrophobic membrane anchor subunit n=1 Tax=Pokkaliibacter plantistimulans TaxID=1635171 RepID=A0ABX5M2Q3_9GAMM|nr:MULTISPECIES: succinate dehydrogenase, hydrophobic membrane anchor protein [Pokkaliibacter]MDH2435872.1 succinate dehydrogenase, hydrophobic membrane anchor protein [Pokkaliibacter sp. MBI-7]PXF33190.1 succinate dehydrogenase [Pokkaliibacter plantistimulans]